MTHSPTSQPHEDLLLALKAPLPVRRGDDGYIRLDVDAILAQRLSAVDLLETLLARADLVPVPGLALPAGVVWGEPAALLAVTEALRLGELTAAREVELRTALTAETARADAAEQTAAAAIDQLRQVLFSGPPGEAAGETPNQKDQALVEELRAALAKIAKGDTSGPPGLEERFEETCIRELMVSRDIARAALSRLAEVSNG